MSKPDPLSWTLRFKKHHTTVLLMLPAQETIQATKEKLHSALKSRSIKDINGDLVPENAADIELGAPIDRNELGKGWVRLDLQADEDNKGSGTSTPKKNGAGPRTRESTSDNLQAAGIRDGQAIAFRFRKASDKNENDNEDEDFEDPGWDVVIPSLDDEEPE